LKIGGASNGAADFICGRFHLRPISFAADFVCAGRSRYAVTFSALNSTILAWLRPAVFAA
jgi:hypothetical protein